MLTFIFILNQVVKEGEETGAEANQMKSKLHKRLILSSFAGGAVFGVLFFVYHIRSGITYFGFQIVDKKY